MGFVEALIGMLAVHYFADFVLQSLAFGGWMGREKWHNPIALVLHAATYTWVLSFGGVAVLLLLSSGMALWPGALLAFVFVNGASHLVIDYVTSKVTHKAAEEQRWGTFWSVHALDQFLHLTILIYSLQWLVSA